MSDAAWSSSGASGTPRRTVVAPPQMAFFQCGATTVLLGVPEENGRGAALEESHLGRRLEEKRHAEGVAIEADGAVEIASSHKDLADSRQTELCGGEIGRA